MLIVFLCAISMKNGSDVNEFSLPLIHETKGSPNTRVRFGKKSVVIRSPNISFLWPAHSYCVNSNENFAFYAFQFFNIEKRKRFTVPICKSG